MPNLLIAWRFDRVSNSHPSSGSQLTVLGIVSPVGRVLSASLRGKISGLLSVETTCASGNIWRPALFSASLTSTPGCRWSASDLTYGEQSPTLVSAAADADAGTLSNEMSTSRIDGTRVSPVCTDGDGTEPCTSDCDNNDDDDSEVCDYMDNVITVS